MSQFAGKDFYEVLGVSRDANQDQIKKAFRILALRVHPDRNPNSETAHHDMILLHTTFEVLSNEEKRALYDETGEVDDMADNGQENGDYWSSLFVKITGDDIIAFEKKYRFSDEEVSDVLNEYVKAKGDMNLVMESVPLCKEEDIPRFVTIISDAISNGTAKKFTKFAKTKNCVTIFKNDASEAAEAEELAHKLGISFSGDDSLQTMIQKRVSSRADAFDSLLAKYSKPNSKAKKQKNTSNYDLDDAEFERIQSEMLAKKNKR